MRSTILPNFLSWNTEPSYTEPSDIDPHLGYLVPAVGRIPSQTLGVRLCLNTPLKPIDHGAIGLQHVKKKWLWKNTWNQPMMKIKLVVVVVHYNSEWLSSTLSQYLWVVESTPMTRYTACAQKKNQVVRGASLTPLHYLLPLDPPQQHTNKPVPFLSRREGFCHKICRVVWGIDIGSPPLITCASFTNVVVCDWVGLLLQCRIRQGGICQYRLVIPIYNCRLLTLDAKHP